MLNPEIVKFFHEFLPWITFRDKVSTVIMIILVITMLTVTFITPIIWNYYLIPKIEKRVGEKLELSPWFNFMLFDFFLCPQFEVIGVIISKYLAIRKGKDPEQSRYVRGRKKEMSWLGRVNYDIRKATKFEIFMAFFTLGLSITCMTGLFLGFLIVQLL